MASFNTTLLAVFAMALLMAAIGLLLWHWSDQVKARRSTMKLLDRRIDAAGVEPVFRPEPEAWQGSPVRAANGEETPESLARRLGATPWISAEPAAGTAATASGLTRGATAARATGSAKAAPRWSPELPAWLLDVATVRSLGMSLAGILLISALAGLVSGSLAAIGALALLLMVGCFVIWLRVQRFRRQLIRQLPGFLDAMVRLITVGNSTQASFQLAMAGTRNPLQGYLNRAASLVRAGVDLDRALHQTASQVRIEEMYLLASILGLGVRYGGRADLLLERVSNFMRDREQAEHELVAMSAETRLSAWVLGVLPVAVGAFIITVNPEYFMRMWQDDTGRLMVFSAIGLQMVGAGLLYRLAKL
ncbi:MAG: type II secretion system F family protein [Polaromonas sp.]|nr:type II secretion system F family protein [Polaromonas sp.]